MNIHPIIVHFPVAFLSVYSLLELVRLRYVTSAVYWFYIKASIVMIGAAASGAAYLSGEIAEELVGESRLVEIHSQWAKMTVLVFGCIAACYAIAWFSRLEIAGRIENSLRLKDIPAYLKLKRLIDYLVGSSVMVLPALVGLVCVLITGALGGSIVYGPDADPFVRIVYDIFIN